MSKSTSVLIEYCGSWGYEGRFYELNDKIKSEFPDVEVTGEIGRQSSYEVSIDGKLIFSKLETYGFPDDQDVLDAVRKACNGEEVPKITNSSSPCNIL